MTKVKICGITNLEDALLSAKFGADALGFNFYEKSPRYITPETAKGIIDQLPENVLKVGVFVNELLENIIQIVETAGLEAIQLHGEETPGFVSELKTRTGLEIIKAFRVSSEFTPEDVLKYDVDAILLDSYSMHLRGGTGRSVDWEIAKRVREVFPRTYLAGGLSPENVTAAKEIVAPFAVDACSSIESEPGKKDNLKLRRFIASSNKRATVTVTKIPLKVLEKADDGDEMTSELIGSFDFEAADFNTLHLNASTDSQLKKAIEIWAIYGVSNNGLSVFLKYGEQHVFTAATRWDFIQPYFLIFIPDEGQFELFFDK